MPESTATRPDRAEDDDRLFSGMNDARRILRPRLQMILHQMKRHSRGDLRRTVLMIALGLGFWTGAFVVALKLLRYFRAAEDIGALLAAKLLAMILLAFGTILLLSNTIAALSNFFLARDLDQLAAAPVRVGALYRARLAETTLHSSWMVLLLLIPVIAAYGAAYEGGVVFAGFAILAVTPFLLIPAACGSSLTLLLVNVFPARRTRDMLSVITALAIATLLVMLRAARPEQLARPEGFADFVQFVAALGTPSSPWLPSEWLSNAVMAHLYGTVPWRPLIRLWITAIVLIAAGHILYARGWRRAYSMAQEGASQAGLTTTHRRAARILSKLGTVRRELVLKELRLFTRDSTQWSQLVLLGVLLVVYVANIRYLPLDGPGVTVLLRNLIPFLNLALAGFVLASVAARFVFPGISIEGRALWLLKSSPLPMRELLLAKFWVGAAPLWLLALILVGSTNFMLGVRPFVHLVSLAAITALVFPLTALALAYGAFYPRFDTENVAQIPTSFGGLLYMMTAVVLIGTMAFLTGRSAARFVMAEHFGWAYDATTMVVPFALAMLLSAAATAIPLELARERLEQSEQT